MQDRLKYRVYFKGSEYAKAGYVDLTRSDVIFSLRADGRIIRTVVYECQQEEHKGEPCNMSFTQNNNLYDIQFCTGLKDKYGKLIYEGDIVKFKFGNEYRNGKVECSQTIWSISNAEFINRAYIGGALINMYSESEIIGNIYENPELLEEVK